MIIRSKAYENDSIVCSNPVLSQKMLVQQVLRNWRRGRIELDAFHRHLGDDLQGKGVLDSLRARRSPHKRSVALDQDCGDLIGIEIGKALDNYIPSLPF